ncbi:MAG: glycosyltransferase family 2 protein [Anaerolineales bacterium]|nr:glycosyltransferase family 2 protein [Anaerolineales bacterium]
MALHNFLLIIFWISASVILYCYIGFPLLLAIRSLFIPRTKIKKQPAFFPKISVIIAAYNEVDSITKKIENVLESDYPHDQLEIIVASDGSTDGTNNLVANFTVPQVRLLSLPRAGKNSAINEAVKTAEGEILIFTDADSLLTPDSLKHIISAFSDPHIGGVAGDYRYASQNIKQEGERAYWNYDRLLKRLQSINGNVSGAAGSLYAIRRSLFKPVPKAVTDDFFSAMQVVSSRHQLVFEPRAIAYGHIASSQHVEFRRKVRIITRGLHGVWLMRHLLNPFSYGFFAIQLFTHKLLRRLMAIPLILLAISAPMLWNAGWLYQVATIFQVVFHGIALSGFVLQNTNIGQTKFFNMPYHFDLIYYASLIALFNTLRGNQYTTWGPERITEASSSLDLPTLQDNSNLK